MSTMMPKEKSASNAGDMELLTKEIVELTVKEPLKSKAGARKISIRKHRVDHPVCEGAAAIKLSDEDDIKEAGVKGAKNEEQDNNALNIKETPVGIPNVEEADSGAVPANQAVNEESIT